MARVPRRCVVATEYRRQAALGFDGMRPRCRTIMRPSRRPLARPPEEEVGWMMASGKARKAPHPEEAAPAAVSKGARWRPGFVELSFRPRPSSAIVRRLL